MLFFIFLFLFKLGKNNLFGLESGDQIGSNTIDASYSSNNLKVNQMRVKNEIADTNISSQSNANRLENLMMSTRINNIYKKENINNINDGLMGSNSLRTSEIIYNGTQILTLIFFISVLFFGLFILVITLIPKYANKFGFGFKREDNLFQQEMNEINLQEDSERKLTETNDGRDNFANNLSLPINRNKNYSLRRHSLISDGSSDHYKIATRPRSSSSLPFVQSFTDTVDDSTTGDESTSRINKNTTLKNFLKKRSSNLELYKNSKTEEVKTSSSGINNLIVTGDEDESGFSPTSASAVVAIQMSELIARWNPKKDSRLIQKMNSNSLEKSSQQVK